jgi:two-component system nitrate/nitrite sensor histidine kinase NarX
MPQQRIVPRSLPEGKAGPRREAQSAGSARGEVEAARSIESGDAEFGLEDAVRPMLEAVVRMAGAAAGTIGLLAGDHQRLEPRVAVGMRPGMDPAGRGALTSWCRECAESRNPDSECVRSRLCGAEDRFSVDLSGQACRHVVVVPLRHRNAAVGTLSLHFDDACALPPETMPLLRATGELIGIALENARLTRENLRASLVSERQLMANEVHDSLAQGLTYMRMRMSLLRDAVKRGDELRAFKYWTDVDESLTGAHGRLRELITHFRSRMDPQGLQHALAELARSFSERTGIALEFANDACDLRLPVARELQLFHIVQEALANICKHANAKQVRFSLAREDGGCEVIVEDDGMGIADPGAAEGADPGHYGIAIMRERAACLGGELTFERASEGGTRVRLRFHEAQLPDRNDR